MVALQRHDHDHGRGDQVCDCAGHQDRQSIARQGYLEDTLGPAPSRLWIRVRTEPAAALALGAARLHGGEIGRRAAILGSAALDSGSPQLALTECRLKYLAQIRR